MAFKSEQRLAVPTDDAVCWALRVAGTVMAKDVASLGTWLPLTMEDSSKQQAGGPEAEPTRWGLWGAQVLL